MCGLMAGTGQPDARIITALGVQNARRGKDSAGIGWVGPKGPDFLKIALHPHVAFTNDLAKAIKKACVSGVVIGHTRQATQGAVTSENAHPFLDKGIVFAHNGIILNDKDFGTYAVDSQSLIHGIEARNFADYKGQIALVWIQGGRLHAYRKGNPLYRAKVGKAVYLASEAPMLYRVGARRVKELTEGRIYVFEDTRLVSNEHVPENVDYTYQPTKFTRGLPDYDSDDYFGRGADRTVGWRDWCDICFMRPPRVRTFSDGKAIDLCRDCAEDTKTTAITTTEAKDRPLEVSAIPLCSNCQDRPAVAGLDTCQYCQDAFPIHGCVGY